MRDWQCDPLQAAFKYDGVSLHIIYGSLDPKVKLYFNLFLRVSYQEYNAIPIQNHITQLKGLNRIAIIMLLSIVYPSSGSSPFASILPNWYLN